jgi:tRNA (guanine-N7-)-methyltransferase
VSEPAPLREPPRSFRRRGRVTAGQQRALDDLWPSLGVDVPDAGAPGAALDLAEVFGNRAPVVLEVGFGQGEATVAMAAADPGRNVLAIDVHRPGAGGLLAAVAAAGLTNVRVAVADARMLLARLDQAYPKGGCLDEVRVYFPDPWPKARHHKRRLLGPVTTRRLAEHLRAGGLLHVATDWTPYADHVLAVIAAEPLLGNAFDGFADRPTSRPVTHYERRGLARGHPVHDIIARRSAGGRPPP